MSANRDLVTKPIYDLETDIFSAGLCIYFMLTNGCHPLLKHFGYEDIVRWFDEGFDDPDDTTTGNIGRVSNKKIDARPPLEQFPLSGLSHLPDALSLVTYMLGGPMMDKSKRPSAKGCLKHNFF